MPDGTVTKLAVKDGNWTIAAGTTNTAVNGDTTHIYRWVGVSTPKTADNSHSTWYMATLCLSTLAVLSAMYVKKSYR